MTTTFPTSDTTSPTPTGHGRPSPQEQAAEVVMPLAAGYVGHRILTIGLRRGLFATMAGRPGGVTATAVADELGFDPFYVSVWCRGALAAGLLEAADPTASPVVVADGPGGVDRDVTGGARLVLAPHVDTLLLDDTSPAYARGQFILLEQAEVFDRFEASLASGARSWWDDASDDFVEAVAESGRPFYTRLVPGGLEQVPGLTDRLDGPARILDTACGAGLGLVRLAATHPEATVEGADGDARSLELARRRVDDAGLGDRVALHHTSLEELDVDDDAYALVVNNISMHECRDADAVTANVRAALEPGGWFVVSDIPFPTSLDALRSTAGRVMSGVQLWEAQIDDQLQPRQVLDDLLDRHGFSEIGHVELAPVHAITHGRA